MLLAGNVSSVNHNRTLPTAQVPASTPRSSLADGCIGNSSHTASPCSGLPSSISVTSHIGSQSGGSVKSGNDIGAVASCSESESLKAVSPVGSATNLISAVAVPQARKASLARFLEKRKERVTNTSPYNASKKSRDCNSPGSESISVSVNSSSSSLLPTTN